MDFASDQHCNKLRDSGKQQVGVQSFFVQGFTSCNTIDDFSAATLILQVEFTIVLGQARFL